MVSRHRRRRKQHAWQPEPTCANCHGRGRHFVPPSLGEPGFYTCAGMRRRDVLMAEMKYNAADFVAYQAGLMRRLADACGMPLDLICLDMNRPPGPWINQRVQQQLGHS
jgi:hypothetical protein